MIILDDLMSIASKDPRINDLFTEGSHHRNLSVILLNQNLYFGKDPTQRRNCHYLVLFNNPIDKQQVMTLARQMYPGNVGFFLSNFNQAVNKPYSYLLVDLKPTTDESNRLCENIFAELGDVEEGINSSKPNCQNHYFSRQPNMTSCDDCGTMFDTNHDVQRHIREKWCPANNKRGHPYVRDSSPPPKRQLSSDDLSSGDEEEIEDNVTFQALWTQTLREFKDAWERKTKAYIDDDGYEEEDAKEQAHEDIIDTEKRMFFKSYMQLLKQLVPLQKNPTHNNIVESILKLLDRKVSLTMAIRKVLKKYKPDFEDLFSLENDS